MTLNTNARYTFLIKAFFIVLLLELFLLGSGQFLSFGGLSLRMVFYSIAISSSVILLLRGIKIAKKVFLFLLVYISMLSFSSYLGIINGADSTQISENLKPLLFAFMILPFSMFITNISRVVLVGKLIKLSGLIMGVSFISVLLLLFFGYMDFSTIYILLSSDSNDFMMNDGENIHIFYKGFLYLNIAFIFYIYSNDKYKLLILSLLFIAILLTFTRGFILALILSFVLVFILEYKQKKSIIALTFIVTVTLITIPFYISFVGDKSESDFMRILQIQQVFDAITLSSFFMGHGYGIGVPIRPNGMEITFLEIFHKQGILGLFLWIGFLFYIIYNYLNIKNITYKRVVKPFVVSTFFVYMQSLTNPYLNNPIGMSMVLLTFSALIVVAYKERKERFIKC
ncbi:MAG: hypothetical protein KN64_00495 [Sulfurovum sp. AS07-7]|nr:MAG: hypothetical protein KN64_00495 [Sulfurovum sp. AS07-7]